jgi:uncharacterized protein
MPESNADYFERIAAFLSRELPRIAPETRVASRPVRIVRPRDAQVLPALVIDHPGYQGGIDKAYFLSGDELRIAIPADEMRTGASPNEFQYESVLQTKADPRDLVASVVGPAVANHVDEVLAPVRAMERQKAPAGELMERAIAILGEAYPEMQAKSFPSAKGKTEMTVENVRITYKERDDEWMTLGSECRGCVQAVAFAAGEIAGRNLSAAFDPKAAVPSHSLPRPERIANRIGEMIPLYRDVATMKNPAELFLLDGFDVEDLAPTRTEAAEGLASAQQQQRDQKESLRNDIDFPRLWELAQQEFALGEDTYHGPDHWKRVERNAIIIAGSNDADLDVVKLFAVLHDSRREDEDEDPEHGPRAAALAVEWRGVHYDCSDEQLRLLVFACAGHTDGYTHKDPTIGACWDGDRLDLPRVNINPEERFMSTKLGKEIVRMGGMEAFLDQSAELPAAPHEHQQQNGPVREDSRGERI